MKAIKRSYYVELRGSELRVEITYYDSCEGDYFSPCSQCEIEIDKITIEDTNIDVTELLCNDYDEIENYIYHEYYA